QRIRWDVAAGIVDYARTSLSEHGGQRHPFRGQERPWSHRDDDGVRLDDAAIDLDASRGRAMLRPDNAGDPSAAQLNTMLLGGAHHCRGKLARMNDRR